MQTTHVYTTPEFWVAVAFVIFVALVGKTIYRMIVEALDNRTETIKNQLNEAHSLRKEAQAMLASCQRKQRAAKAEAARIIEHAEEEAKRIKDRAAKDLNATLKRCELQAVERISYAESKAVAEVRSMAADFIVDVAERVIKDNLEATKAGQLIDLSIKRLSGKLH